MNQQDASSSAPGGIIQWIPALGSLRHYGGREARADLVAGLTVATVAVPQAMAYAMIAGLPAEYGLYTAIVMTAVGAVFDSSRQLINGPTNAISIAVLSAISFVEGPEQRIQAVVLLAFMMGVIQIAITLFRLGDLTRYISHSVIVGFTAGASALLVLDQTKHLLGLEAMGGGHDHFLYRFWLTLTKGGNVHLPTAAIGFGTILALTALRWLKARLGWQLLPELLLIVTAMAGLVAYTGLDQQGVKVVGEIPAKLPSFQPPAFNALMIRDFSTGALAIALLGLLEATAMAKAIAAQTRQKLDMNQQCLSEGLANLVGSFFQCMPGSGSLTRSAINQQAGAVTQWSGVVSAVAVAVITMVVAPYARFIPRAALAGILIFTAWRMVNRRELAYHIRSTRFDAAIVGVTAFSAVAISVEFCILIGVFMSFLLTVPRAGRMQRTEFVVTRNGEIHERLADDEVCGHILIFGLEGELFFGASAALEKHFKYFEERASDQTRVVVLRMKRLRNPDAAGLSILQGFLDRLKARGIHVIMCGVRGGMYETMTKAGMAARLGENEVFLEQPVRQTSTMLAIRHGISLIDSPCPACPHSEGSTRGEAFYYVI